MYYRDDFEKYCSYTNNYNWIQKVLSQALEFWLWLRVTLSLRTNYAHIKSVYWTDILKIVCAYSLPFFRLRYLNNSASRLDMEEWFELYLKIKIVFKHKSHKVFLMKDKLMCGILVSEYLWLMSRASCLSYATRLSAAKSEFPLW